MDPLLLTLPVAGTWHAAPGLAKAPLCLRLYSRAVFKQLCNTCLQSMCCALLARGTRPCRGAVVSQAVSADGWTPLQLAARGGAADKVALLLAAGADPTAANQQVCDDAAQATD